LRTSRRSRVSSPELPVDQAVEDQQEEQGELT
jgi:hypothetical protein